ncbi:unnamed protein product [Arctia plantaginis]|uniref:Uncharacterized protein n=1 Tax=Arctia plantaginis TaxID=874455 RepID=A0A8S0Z407_ARCPL|nr:unnamed protein product [Arctia plantaginis]
MWAFNKPLPASILQFMLRRWKKLTTLKKDKYQLGSWFSILLLKLKLKKIGIRGKQNCFRATLHQIKIGEHLSGSVPVEDGVPQYS